MQLKHNAHQDFNEEHILAAQETLCSLCLELHPSDQLQNLATADHKSLLLNMDVQETRFQSCSPLGNSSKTQ